MSKEEVLALYDSLRESWGKERHAEIEREIDTTKPQPCTRFCNAGTVEWIAKLTEETNEAIQEAKKVYALEKADEDGVEYAGCIGDAEVTLAEELTDVITVCVSWLHALGYDEYLRGEVQKRVNEKNKARGYF